MQTNSGARFERGTATSLVVFGPPLQIRGLENFVTRQSGLTFHVAKLAAEE